MNQPRKPRTRSTMPCPNCSKLVSIDSEKCIHCGYSRPGRFYGIPIIEELMSGQISFAEGIVLVCFLLFALAIGLEIGPVFEFSGILELLSPTTSALDKLGMGGLIPVLHGRWWSLLTATYLHGSILHIAFNMLWLRQIGPLVEELFGNSRFLVIYTTAGIGGAVLTTVLGTPFFVGASGAIFGLFAALIYYGYTRGGTFGSAIFRRMLIWAVIGFVFGFVVPGVDNWGHAGGFATGLLTAVILGYSERRKEKPGHHILAAAILMLILVCFGLMVARFFMM